MTKRNMLFTSIVSVNSVRFGFLDHLKYLHDNGFKVLIMSQLGRILFEKYH